ncbi:MAG: thioredoxin family protein [Flavobacterium sp. BFFFF2]|nr:MAG: thioredoxin family protein [Flavobacterium sp. BFFFF2]
MKKQLLLCCLVAFALVTSGFVLAEKAKIISNFKLKSATTNKMVSLADYQTAKGFMVIFTCNKCPMAKLYLKRLNQMDATYKKRGVPLIAINSMDTLAYAEESFKKMQQKAQKEQFSFPYLQDKKQVIVKAFKASHTPQAYVIWKNNAGKWVVKYEGAIDDNAGEPEKATQHYLTDAVDQLLANKEVTTPTSESFGCRIFLRGVKQKMD